MQWVWTLKLASSALLWPACQLFMQTTYSFSLPEKIKRRYWKRWLRETIDIRQDILFLVWLNLNYLPTVCKMNIPRYLTTVRRGILQKLDLTKLNYSILSSRNSLTETEKSVWFLTRFRTNSPTFCASSRLLKAFSSVIAGIIGWSINIRLPSFIW